MQVWRPNLQQDINLIEGVHKRAMRMSPDINWKTYEHHLRATGLIFLETRRFRVRGGLPSGRDTYFTFQGVPKVTGPELKRIGVLLIARTVDIVVLPH
ncbi:hypothetical protein LSAT2_007876 [Lamellibrachia satsuma]|nr:hypothetical protein LSAT2_007876 [Lamellibrachia satsuma]